jgi:hypothetical protein
LGSQQQQEQFQRLDVMEGAGEKQRAMQDRSLETGYQDWQNQMDQERRNIDWQQRAMSNLPYQGTVTESGYRPTGGPTGDLMSTGIAGIGAYGDYQGTQNAATAPATPPTNVGSTPATPATPAPNPNAPPMGDVGHHLNAAPTTAAAPATPNPNAPPMGDVGHHLAYGGLIPGVAYGGLIPGYMKHRR